MENLFGTMDQDSRIVWLYVAHAQYNKETNITQKWEEKLWKEVRLHIAGEPDTGLTNTSIPRYPIDLVLQKKKSSFQ